MMLAKPFPPVKLVCGLISSEEEGFHRAEERLVEDFGPADSKSALYPFDSTDYYEREMGEGLNRMFLSFERLLAPERLSEIKLRTNRLEGELWEESGRKNRIVNIDPGFMTASALFMATTKDFAHRVPLRNGIYAHLELLFTRTGVRCLEWTYPDFRTGAYNEFLLGVRKLFLNQLKNRPDASSSSG